MGVVGGQKHGNYEKMDKPLQEDEEQINELVSFPPTPLSNITPPAASSAQQSPLNFSSHGHNSPFTTAAADDHGTPPPENSTFRSSPFSNIVVMSPAAAQPSPDLTPARTPVRFMSPLQGSPMRKVFTNMKQYLEGIGHLTKLNPQDAWLPITESRSGNAYYSAFHNLNAGIGFQALLLPVAFTFLGWTWGTVALVTAFLWQLHTLRLLIYLHEADPGKRYNRYIELSMAAFGERLGVWLSLLPVINLSAGTATGIVIIGGSTLRLFYETVCGLRCQNGPLTVIEWYLVFAILCCLMAQLPNLNSVAYVSLVGAVMSVAYCTMVWILSISKHRPEGISYSIEKPGSSIATVFSILNALGIIAFAFRGHNLALEIQATMPSTLKHPAHVPMWRGTEVAYIIVAFCFFPLAIGGYWAYGNKMLSSGILYSLAAYHRDISPAILGATFLCVILSLLSSFQIYSLPMFDSFEQAYTSKTNKPCPKLIRFSFRLFFVFICFFIAIALPFISSFAGLIGGLTNIPVTFTYPCFMWLSIRKPAKYTFNWYINWILGTLGTFFTFAVTAGGIWSIVDTGLKISFFKPQ